MTSSKDIAVMEKIEDLTESLSRTTDVLSSADRMIDHYRNLNSEQEYVIAKLKEDLRQSNEMGQHQASESGRGKQRLDASQDHEPLIAQRDLKQTLYPIGDDLYSDDDGRSTARAKIPHSSKVRFKEQSNGPEIESLRSKMTEFQRKQDLLESELETERLIHEEELTRLDTTIKQQLSMELSSEKSEINDNLKRIQQKLEEDQIEYNKQNLEVQSISQEMRSLKDLVQEAATPKRSEDTELERKIVAYKKKIFKQDDVIKMLKLQLETKTEEERELESTIHKMQSLEKVKSQQLKLAEQQLGEEKMEKMNLLKELEVIQQKLTDANRERSELLYHLTDVKSDGKTEKMAYEQCINQNTQLKSLLEKAERDKEHLSVEINTMKNEMQLKNDALIEKLKSQLNDFTTNIKEKEVENEKLSEKIKEVALQCETTKAELESTKKSLLESAQKCKEIESSKVAVKEKALNSLREYRNKYKKLEKQIQVYAEEKKMKEIELSKAIAASNDQEIANLRLKKDLQEFTSETENLKKVSHDAETSYNQVVLEKSVLEQELSRANEQVNKNSALERDVGNLKKENESLNTKLKEEKKKREDAQASLQEHYEKSITSKEEHTVVKMQMEEQRKKVQFEHEMEVTRLQQTLATSNEKLIVAEEKLIELSKNNDNTLKTLKSCEQSLQSMEKDNEGLDKKLREQASDLSKEEEKVRLLTQKFRKVVEENKKAKQELQDTKENLRESQSQLRESQSNATRQQNALAQRPESSDNRQQSMESSVKNDDVAKVFTILLQDSENLLSLLSYEEENVPAVHVIPLNIVPEHRKAILEIREKYQTCYSITKTLKGRFQQQKNLIRRAQEKIRSQMEQIRILNDTQNDTEHLEKIATLEELRKNDKEKIALAEGMRLKDQEKIESLEKLRKNDHQKCVSLETMIVNDREKINSLEAIRIDSQKVIDSHILSCKELKMKLTDLEGWRKRDVDLIAKKDAEIVDMKHRIQDLTRDLEGCTRALHKSIEVDKERKSVLAEIDLLKTEHKERQQIDEDFFRCSEKIESLTDQLNEAKSSLNDIKQDSASRYSVTRDRLVESFGSVSPSSKRRRYLFDSPLFKATKDLEDDYNALPTHDTDGVKKLDFDANETSEDIIPRTSSVNPL